MSEPRGKELARQIRYSIKVSLRHSFYLTTLLVLFFGICRIIGIAKNMDIHYVNYIFAFFIANHAIREEYNKEHHYINYFVGAMITIVTITLGHLWYAILFFIYLFIDTDFTTTVMHRLPIIYLAPRLSIAAILLSEGLGFSTIMALFQVQYFLWRHKLNPNVESNEE